MNKRVFCSIFSAIVLLLLLGCGGGGSSDGSTGTLTANITDAKPVILGDPEEIWITFEEVLAHRSEGGWISLPLPQTPLTINLRAFHDGETTQLVTPVELASGKYTQIRFVISDAHMVITGVAQSIDLDVPSGNLKTDKNFTFEVVADTAVDITVDFDLSQSIVVTGDNQYKLKPVLHINETQEAGTIRGKLDNNSFGVSPDAIVTVFWDENGDFVADPDEAYTKVVVVKDQIASETEFSVFWMVREDNYIVLIEADTDNDSVLDLVYDEDDIDLKTSGLHQLNGGLAI